MITPPNYKKNATPSPRGWRHPRTGELLKKQNISQEEINEYLGVGIVSAPEPEVLIEADPIVEDDITLEVLMEEEVEVEVVAKKPKKKKAKRSFFG